MANQRRAAMARAFPNRAMRWIAAGLALTLGVQIARLLIALLTPQGPLGVPAQHQAQASTAATALRFDPFFRTASADLASGTVTGLPIKLFGTRVDFATGQGSAIIATPDGVQSSYVVGEVVMPGAKLTRVARDHVEIDRGGTRERLFLDQSVPAPPPPPVAMVAPVPAPAVVPAPEPLLANEAAPQ